MGFVAHNPAKFEKLKGKLQEREDALTCKWSHPNDLSLCGPVLNTLHWTGCGGWGGILCLKVGGIYIDCFRSLLALVASTKPAMPASVSTFITLLTTSNINVNSFE